MSKTAARLARAEQNGHQRVLDELAKRRGILRWVCYASDAEPFPNEPGFWRSDTFDLLANLPSDLIERGMEAIGYIWEIEPELGPKNDEA